MGHFGKFQEMPQYMFCPRQKINPMHFQNQRYIGIFMSLREREREKERARARARAIARARAKARVRERERERERKIPGDYISKPPEPK